MKRLPCCQGCRRSKLSRWYMEIHEIIVTGTFTGNSTFTVDCRWRTAQQIRRGGSGRKNFVILMIHHSTSLLGSLTRRFFNDVRFIVKFIRRVMSRKLRGCCVGSTRTSTKHGCGGGSAAAAAVAGASGRQREEKCSPCGFDRRCQRNSHQSPHQ